MKDVKKHIEVVAAVIRDEDGKILATQRGYGAMKDGWEFPGGKMEPGETPQEALQREISEDLAVTIEVDEFLCTVHYNYPEFYLTMHCYWCHVVQGAVKLLEHEAARWLTMDQLNTIDWLPADQEVIERMM